MKHPLAGDSLEKYIKVAEILKRDPKFHSTPMGQFESVILDPKQALLTEMQENTSLKENQKIKYKEGIDALDFSSTFIAHVSSSFEGKTQSAFILSKVRPLYFAMNQYTDDEAKSVQSIYISFKSLNDCISKLAHEDQRAMLELKYRPNNDSEYSYKVLGFLAHLIDDAEANFDPNSDRSWMDFYANREDRPAKVFFNSMEIANFKEKLAGSSKYCLFLDEYIQSSDSFSSIDSNFIRELAISAGLRCVVSNTSTSSVNIPRYDDNYTKNEINPYCIIINKLNPVNSAVVDWDKLRSEVLEKLPTCSAKEDFNDFFDNFLIEQVPFIRPGIMIKFAECLEHQKDLEFKSFSDFLSGVVKRLSGKIISQKLRKSDSWKCFGALDLISHHSFRKIRSRERSGRMFERKSFLTDYLYYLINPVEEKLLKFIIFIRPNRNENQFDFLNKTGAREEWGFDSLFMKADDFFTLLACLCVPYKVPIRSRMKRERRSNESSCYSFFSSEPSYYFVEREIENSIIHASHMKSAAEANVILDGRSGDSFMFDFVQNLIEDTSHRVSSEGISLKYDCETTLNFLQNVTVPFLFSDNFTTFPIFLQNLINKKLVNVEKLINTPHESWMDSNFAIKSGEVESKASLKVKNKIKKADNLAIQFILENALSNNNLMTLIVCNAVNKKNIENCDLNLFCLSQSVKLLRLTRESKTKNYTISDHFQDLIVEEPKLYAFIFEMDVINTERD